MKETGLRRKYIEFFKVLLTLQNAEKNLNSLCHELRSEFLAYQVTYIEYLTNKLSA